MSPDTRCRKRAAIRPVPERGTTLAALRTATSALGPSTCPTSLSPMAKSGSCRANGRTPLTRQAPAIPTAADKKAVSTDTELFRNENAAGPGLAAFLLLHQ